MNKIFVLALALFSGAAFAQFCDVIYTMDVDVEMTPGAEPININTVVGFAYGLPLADAEANTKLGKKVINEASKQQDKGGPYLATYSEMRSCDGKVPVRADGIFVQGVTLKGANAISRVALKVGEEVTQRYEKRAAKGETFGNDHSKAKKIKRDPNTGKRERQAIVAGD